MMEINRRRFLSSGMALGSTTIIGASIASSVVPLTGTAYASAERTAHFASAYTDLDGEHFVAVVNQQGLFKSNISVPSRGHSACFSNDGKRVAFFARRPGRWLKVVNLESGSVEVSVVAGAGRHFFWAWCLQ